MGVSPSAAQLGKGGELPDLNRPQYYSRPKSGNDDGTASGAILLNIRGKKIIIFSDFYPNVLCF